MSADQITPEEIKSIREAMKSHKFAGLHPDTVDRILDALESSRAEVEMHREQCRLMADDCYAEVQRLTEEARRPAAVQGVEVPDLTYEAFAEIMDTTELIAGVRQRETARRERITQWFRSRLSPSPQPATGAAELASDEWRRAGLTPQQMWEEIQEIRELVGCDGTHGSPRDAVARKLDACQRCDGNGWTAEHDPTDPHDGGVCESCPIQVQCEECEGTGYVLRAQPTNDETRG